MQTGGDIQTKEYRHCDKKLDGPQPCFPKKGQSPHLVGSKGRHLENNIYVAPESAMPNSIWYSTVAIGRLCLVFKIRPCQRQRADRRRHPNPMHT